MKNTSKIVCIAGVTGALLSLGLYYAFKKGKKRSSKQATVSIETISQIETETASIEF